MKISVVIPFYRGRARLETCLGALAGQTHPAHEVIVVDNGSPEDLRPLQEDFRWVKWLKEGIIGSYAARNLGLTQATGEVIAFTDADCVPLRTWIEEGVRALREGGWSIVGGRVAMMEPAGRGLNACETIEEIFFGLSDQKRLVETRGFAATANVFTYRAVFDQVGMFDAKLRSSGDLEWARRATAAGASLGYAAEAIVHHPRRATFGEVLKKALRLAGGKMTMLTRSPPQWGQVGLDLYRQSPFNPKMHLFCWSSFKSRHLKSKCSGMLLIEILSLIALAEKIRVLIAGRSRRS